MLAISNRDSGQLWGIKNGKKRRNYLKRLHISMYIKTVPKNALIFPTFFVSVPGKKLICDHSSHLCSIYDFLDGPLKCGVTNSKTKVFIS